MKLVDVDGDWRSQTSGEVFGLFESINWHDSVLEELRVIRRGSADRVELVCKFLVDWDAQVEVDAELHLEGCESILIDATGGVDCTSVGEVISEASWSSEGSEIDAALRMWSGIRKPNNLIVLRFSLSSTGSSVACVFTGVRVLRPTNETTTRTPGS